MLGCQMTWRFAVLAFHAMKAAVNEFAAPPMWMAMGAMDGAESDVDGAESLRNLLHEEDGAESDVDVNPPGRARGRRPRTKRIRRTTKQTKITRSLSSSRGWRSRTQRITKTTKQNRSSSRCRFQRWSIGRSDACVFRKINHVQTKTLLAIVQFI